MEIKSKIKKKNSVICFFIYLSILMISIFPIFGEYGDIIKDIIIWLTVIIGFIYFITKEVILTRYIIFFGMYIIFSIISVLWSINLGGAYIRILNMIQCFLFMTVILSFCEEEDIHKCMDVYLVGVLIISVFCFIQDFSSLSIWARLGKNAFEKAGQNQIYYSCILINATMYAIYKLSQKKQKKSLYIFIVIFLILCGVLTAVRKNFIIPIIFIIVFEMLNNKNNILKLIVISFLLVMVFIGIYKITINSFPSMSYRINSLINDISKNTKESTIGNSFSTRKWLRYKAFDLFKENPLFGVGIGQFRFYAADYGVDMYSHNNYLEILANTGIIGFLIYYIPIFILLFKSIRGSNCLDKKINIFIAAFLISTLIMEYGQVDYYQLFYIFFIALFSYGTKQKSIKLFISKGKS